MTTAIEVYRSNRNEHLVQALLESLKAPLSNPMTPELIVVQGRGMGVWLNQQLSRQLGVWANADFIYPKHFVERAMAAVLPETDTKAELLGREPLFWSVMTTLPRFLSRPEFAAPARYLQNDLDGSRLFQLAERIAAAFDEYLIYRPELLLRWEKDAAGSRDQAQLDLFTMRDSTTLRPGDHEAWQASLWRAIQDDLARRHPDQPIRHSAALEAKFIKALSRKGQLQNLPERISVFGLSNLPPQYVRVLAALAVRTSVRLFLLSPTQEYFGDAVRKTEKLLLSPEQNPLLMSCGTLGAELQEVMTAEFEARKVVERGVELYQAHPSERLSALQRLQNDVLAHQNGPELGQCRLEADDESISFQSCHSAIREVEVLHDQLLRLLDTPRPATAAADDAPRRTYRPEDIVVMMPNVDDYAPLIEAVFERSRDDTRFIPYRISDRALQADSPILDAFLRIVALAGARGSASEVLDVLALEPVRARFGISATEVSTIANWVVNSNIRWGFDAAHRQQHDLPADDKNTWQFGLRRLLLGYAVNLPGDTCLGVSPYTEIEGKTGVLLGRFAHFVETLFSQLRALRQKLSVSAWQQTLGNLLAQLLVQDSDSAWQHQEALTALAEINESASAAGFDETLELSVMRGLLDDQFERKRAARGFLSGGVTFCAMVPMRSIPFPVICLLGMNDGAFPRNSHRADFNLLEHGGYPRKLGDPNRRTDDRYLFLEVLLSAREKLLISYIGQSVRDNAPLPPSIVVAELQDYLSAQYGGADPECQTEVLERLTTRHPLQPFSPRYFNGYEPSLFSYEHAFLKGAKLLGPERRPATPLFAQPLPPADLGNELELSELVEFYASPANFLLRQRLGVNLEEHELEIADREPLQLDGLESYQVGAPALDRRLRGVDSERSLELTAATGLLPAGAPGRYEFQRVLRSAEPIAEATLTITTGEPLPHAAVALSLDVPDLGRALQLRGVLGDLWPAGHVQHQFSRIRGKHLLSCWIRHLVLCSVKPAGVAQNTWLVGRRAEGEGKRIHRFQAVAEPEAILRELLELYAHGLTEPLLLFPDASFAFAQHSRTPRGDQRQALYHAGVAWRRELRFSRVLQRLFGQDGDLTAAGPAGLAAEPKLTFAQVSQRVYGPLLDHLEEVG